MSIYLDRQYVNLLSPRLEQFKWKSGTLAVSRCPICGDSQKNKLKCRFYIYERDGCYVCHCHNCSITLSLGKLLKDMDPQLYRDYLLDRFKDKEIQDIPAKIKNPKPVHTESIDIGKHMAFCAYFPQNTNPIDYLKKRKINPDFWSEIYYTQRFRTSMLNMAPLAVIDKELPDDERIVFPFYDVNKRLVGLTARTLTPNVEPRYIILKIVPDTHTVFGLERFDRTREGYVVEGPIDSFFLPNAIAACGSNLGQLAPLIDPHLVTFILDNEPRNKDIIRAMSGIIQKKLKLFIWPKHIKEKDLNEWFLTGISQREILETIYNNTFSDIDAQFRLTLWKKI